MIIFRIIICMYLLKHNYFRISSNKKTLKMYIILKILKEKFSFGFFKIMFIFNVFLIIKFDLVLSRR